MVNMKIWIHPKTKKVVFAEAGKEFVDFLFHIMKLPLSTVVKLVSGKDKDGHLAALYESIESLETKYFVDNRNKDSVLMPISPAVLPIMFGNDNAAINIMASTFASLKSSSSNNVATGFVKELVTYMVMDNLAVKPMSITNLKLHVGDITSLEEKEVEVGPQEKIEILKASLETNSALTTVFVGAASVKKVERPEGSDDPYFLFLKSLERMP